MAQIQYEVPELLVRAGATLRPHNRADCPRCGRRRAVSYTPELYFCHGVDCQFAGNDFLLASELGVLNPLPPGEAKRQREARERARQAAQFLQERIRQRVSGLQKQHRDLLDLYFGALRRLKPNPQDEIGWTLLAYTYREIPLIRAELAILEESPIKERLAFLGGSKTQKEEAVAEVLMAGGLYNSGEMFVEIGF